ncbi:MAG TPA: sigma-70 family RNA polymerase sigma factor [Acetobacteraceae bacterium]|nr:sigma-70 family RNA polymerase sigma factor [Acetobacteraceae bacterium]
MLSQIEACVPALRRYAAALLRNRQDADDLVHDCLVRALDKLHTRHEDGDVRAWLFSILHNLFISQRRRAASRPEHDPLDAAEGVAFHAASTQEDTLRWQELIRAVDRLPADQRTVILLVSVEDHTYAEAARVLGVPIGTVMSRLARARERLREMVSEPKNGHAESRRLRVVK